MAIQDTASIIPLHQGKRAMTGAERARLYRLRKKAKLGSQPKLIVCPSTQTNRLTIQPDRLPGLPSRLFAWLPSQTVTPVTSRHVTSRHVAGSALAVAAFALAAVGITMNGWFARSLGSSDIAGWLFLGVGVAADLAALAIPSRATRLWQTQKRGTALVGWLLWGITFAFAVTAGIGFASVNIADVTMARASRSTPAIVAAQTALNDAMAARDRECRGGVGKFCREREQSVVDRRQSLDAAMRGVEHNADPQTEAAIKIVAWLSLGIIRPSSDDFVLIRLILLAVLPQIGGVLLMIGNRR